MAYHGGMLAAIESVTGWDPRTADVVVGTSAGSVTGALLRLGLGAGDLAAVSEELPLSPEGQALVDGGFPHRARVMTPGLLRPRTMADPGAVLRAMLRPWARTPASLWAAMLPAGWVSTDTLSGGLDASFGARWPARTYFCALRLHDGQRVVFGTPTAPRTTVGQAVAASCAIPGYYAPVRIDGERYVDGGVHSMSNVDIVTTQPVEAGPPLDLVVVSAPLAYSARWPGFAPDLLMRQAMRAEVRTEAAWARRAGIPVVVVAPSPSVVEAMGLNPMDARRRGGVSRSAREGTQRFLEDNRRGRELADLLRSAVPAGRSA